jgi:lipid A ethanolaminephosphotransferase
LLSKKQKILVVLHTKGSHGPSYNTQYPPKFEKYTPVCKSVELSKCSNEELINAYDNTIFYTDYFINKTINILKNLKNIPSMLIYASDHGESLGEYGLYLHGTPYSIAPDYQTKIPFMIWLSAEFKNQKNISSMVQKKSHSHENIFHTIIGAYEMQTKIYKPNLDILRAIK